MYGKPPVALPLWQTRSKKSKETRLAERRSQKQLRNPLFREPDPRPSKWFLERPFCSIAHILPPSEWTRTHIARRSTTLGMTISCRCNDGVNVSVTTTLILNGYQLRLIFPAFVVVVIVGDSDDFGPLFLKLASCLGELSLERFAHPQVLANLPYL